MKLSGIWLWGILLVVLGFSMLAALKADPDSSARVPGPTVREATPELLKADAPPLPDLDLADMEKRLKRGGKSRVADAFAPKTWLPPPRPAVVMAPVPPPLPQAPPLPFTYLGSMIEGGKTVVFLASQDTNYSLRVGETVSNTYRVDRITEGAVTFTYLPLNIEQTLSIGGPR